MFIAVLVLVVDNTAAAAADHSHPPRQWVVLHTEEDNSLQRLPVLVPEPSYEHITFKCVICMHLKLQEHGICEDSGRSDRYSVTRFMDHISIDE